MYELTNGKASLFEEFFNFHDTTNRVEIQKLKRKIQKFLRTAEGDRTQLMDVILILDSYIDEFEYNNFSSAYHIVAPVVERLVSEKNWDFYDTHIAALVVGYGKDYKVTNDFAQRILSALEEYKSKERYNALKLATCFNVLSRFLRAKYFELENIGTSADFEDLTNMFT